MPHSHYIGFDPGGKKAFGWAVVSASNQNLSLIAKGTCSDAATAIKAAAAANPSSPVAVAVDAPLFWIPAGDRKADRIVRKMVCNSGGNSGTVNHINSMRGACLVQGILVARMAVSKWTSTSLTEAHPKALLGVSTHAREFVKTVASSLSNEHERDAALAAFTALNFAAQTQGWHDLAIDALNFAAQTQGWQPLMRLMPIIQ